MTDLTATIAVRESGLPWYTKISRCGDCYEVEYPPHTIARLIAWKRNAPDWLRVTDIGVDADRKVAFARFEVLL